MMGGVTRQRPEMPHLAALMLEVGPVGITVERLMPHLGITRPRAIKRKVAKMWPFRAPIADRRLTKDEVLELMTRFDTDECEVLTFELIQMVLWIRDAERELGLPVEPWL